MTQPMELPGRKSLPNRWHYIVLALFGLALFVVLLTGLPNLTDNEWRISAYVLDAINNGHWFVQTDSAGEVASKPPLLTWLVSLAVIPTGEISRVALYWPSATATIVVGLVLIYTGSRAFGAQAGHWAAFSYLVSHVAIRQMEMARYDGLLTLAVTLGSLAAFKAWQTGQGWVAFWVIAALGTLVKGPLALLLMSGGLLAVLSFRGESRRLLGTGHLTGIGVYFAIAGGWFALAYVQMGDPLIDKMLRRELLGHAVSGYSQGREWHEFIEPVWSFVRSYAPWSLVTVAAFWRIFRQPAAGDEERRFERFLLAWFLVGLAVFCLASHQRGRLILPLIPAAALLTGRELNRWTAHAQPVRLFQWASLAGLLFLAGVTLYSHWLLKASRSVQETLAAQELVERLRTLDLGEFPFTYVDNVHALQVWCSTRRTAAPVPEAMKLLRGDNPVFVVVTKTALPLEDNTDNRIREVFRWPAHGKARFRIISNHPRLEWTENAALWLDGMEVKLMHARLYKGDEDELQLWDDESSGEVAIVNHTPKTREFTVRVDRPGTEDLLQHRHLLPNVPQVLSWRPR